MTVGHIEWGDYEDDFDYRASIGLDYSFLKFDNVDDLDRVIKKLNTNFQNTLSNQRVRDQKINAKFDELKNDTNKRISDVEEILDIIKDAYNRFVDEYNKFAQDTVSVVNSLTLDVRSLDSRVSALESKSSSSDK